MNTGGLAAGAAGLLLLLAGCQDRSSAVPPLAVQPTSTAVTGAYGVCPSPTPLRPDLHAAIDYADVLQAFGHTYVRDYGKATTPASQPGSAQFKVRCTFSIWTQTFGQAAELSDHDATFLRPGTVVYAVSRSSPRCVLMARTDDGWQRFTSRGAGC